MSYSVRLISPEEREALASRYVGRILFTRKSEIYGCCIKLLTDQDLVRRTWEDNFYAMAENVRSHGRLVVLDDASMPPGVLYDPLTRTAFMFNIHYYGFVKSAALAIAGDILEDAHGIYSVHGAAIDVAGKGIALIAPSKTGKTTHSWGLLRHPEARKTGKTTHSWGLLRHPEARLVTDDWFFVRLSEKRHLAFASEKNCYVEGDIGGIWKEFQPLVDKATFDGNERAIMNVRWIVGATGVVPMTSLHHVLLLKRDREDARVVRDIGAAEALAYLEANDFCNPHQLVKGGRKMGLRSDFFRRLLDRTEVHMVNTILSPQDTQTEIQRALGLI
jgi:hypothetical protein